MTKFEQFLREESSLDRNLNINSSSNVVVQKKKKPDFFEAVFNSKSNSETSLNAIFVDEELHEVPSEDSIFIFGRKISSMFFNGSNDSRNLLRNYRNNFCFLDTLNMDPSSIESLSNLGVDGVFCSFADSFKYDLGSITLVFETCKDFGLWASLDILDEKIRGIYFDSDISFSFLDVSSLKIKFGNQHETFVGKLLDDFRYAKLERRIPRVLFLIDKSSAVNSGLISRAEIIRIEI